MKKILSVLLVAVMLLTAVPLSGFVGLELPAIDLSAAFAPQADAATSGDYKYSVSDGKATITDVDTSISGSVTIPSKLGGYPVVSIGNYAFEYCTKLTSITVPDSVTSIGGRAFSYCTKLTSITVTGGNGYYSSDSYGVLFNKNKTELIQYPCGNTRSAYAIPSIVTSIGEGAFSDCESLTSITIPDSVTSIGRAAFSYCDSLTSITIPDGVTSISEYAFFFCHRLTSITIPSGVTSIGKYAFTYCNSLTSITIPDGVTSIGEYAFSDCESLTSITIPDGVTSIGERVFYGCTGLTSITIPDGVTSIGERAFDDCTGLTSITIPVNVSAIGKSAFDNCTALDSVVVFNSGCTVYDSETTFPENATLFGYAGSHLQTYAEKYNRTFSELVCAHALTESIPEVAATCIATGLSGGVRCLICRTVLEPATETPIIDHDYQGVVTTEPTHMKTGVRTWTCSMCHDSYTEELAKLTEHIYNKTVTAPKCETAGYTFFVCPCGHNYVGDYVTALGHSCNEADAIVVPATCAATGSKTYVCTTCKKDISETLAIDENNHIDYDETIVASTCTIKGTRTIDCRTCQKIITEEIPVDVNNHVEQDETIIASTCSKKGTRTLVCKACANVTTETLALDKNNHVNTNVKTDAATCTTTGLKTTTCADCKKTVKTEVLSVDKNNHVTTDYTIVASTCTVPGLKTTFCVACNEILQEDVLPTDASNHIKWNESIKEPTCTVSGVKTLVCDACGKTEYESIDSLGHDKVSHSKKDATCTECGWEPYETCTRCDFTSYVEIPALGHQEATFVENHNGMKVYICARNSDHIYSIKEIGNLGDVDENGVVTSSDARSALRFAVGLDTPTSKQFSAADVNKNGVIASDDARTILRVAVGLDFLEDETTSSEVVNYYTSQTNPTCTKDGEYCVICQDCEKTVKKTVLPATGHSYTSSVTKKATCTAEGVRTFTCSACSASYTEAIAMIEHSYEKQIKNPTCISEGYEKTVCRSCGDVASSKTLAATGQHSYTSSITKEATCVNTGIKTYSCSYCSSSYTETIEISGQHTYTSSITKKADCIYTGVKTYTCKYCSSSYTETIAKTGHTYSNYYCTVCKKIQSGYMLEFLNYYLKKHGTKTASGNYQYKLSKDSINTFYLVGNGSGRLVLERYMNIGNGLQTATAFTLPFGDASGYVTGLIEYTDNGSRIAVGYFEHRSSYFSSSTSSVSFYSYSGSSSLKQSLAQGAASDVNTAVYELGIQLMLEGYGVSATDLGFPYLS